MPTRTRFGLFAALALFLAAGCAPKTQREPRHIGADVLGGLVPQALREAYATPAFVVRDLADGRHVALQDTDLPPAALREISRRTRIPLSPGAPFAVSPCLCRCRSFRVPH